MKSGLTKIVLTLVVGASSALTASSAEVQCGAAIPAYAPFDPARLSAHVRILASDAFEGRAPGSNGEALTVQYLIRQFTAAGVKPAGDGEGWTQAVPLRRFTLSASNVRLRREGRTERLRQGIDWAGASLAGVPVVNIEDVPVVFVGYGVSAPERGWDDYKNIDLRNKVALFLVNDPDFEAPESGRFGGRAMTYYGRWTYKFEEAARRGAVAALLIHETAPASYGWETVRNSWEIPQFDIERADPRKVHPLFEGWLRRDVAARMFQKAGMQFEQAKRLARRPDFVPMELRGTRLFISARVEVRPTLSHNVIGELPGQKRAMENVVYSAHWDHLGIGTPDSSGDRIYNGAVDNALGVAGLLELARVFASGAATDRSLTFIAFTGEEKGLLGSKFYVEHPTRPIERTAAVFNMDIGNPNGPACDVQPWGTKQNTLQDNLADMARGDGRRLSEDDHPEAGYFYRSDHFSFAQRGVPAITLGSGRTLYDGGTKRGERLYNEYIERHYHQPSDEWSAEWDLRGQALELRLLHDVGRAIANSRKWPTWLDGSEFKIPRDLSSGSRSSEE